MEVVACIPTCKNKEEVSNQEKTILFHSKFVKSVYISARKAPASVNRNLCLNAINSDIVIMLDDDMAGFYKNWDEDLIKPLLEDSTIGIIVARLLKQDSSIAFMSGDTGDLTSHYFDTRDKHLCTACFAMRKNDVRYDEGFLGSGFEDTDFGLQFIKTFPDKRIVINNRCRLIHINEMKNQNGPYWTHNKNYFLKKYPGVKDTWHD